MSTSPPKATKKSTSPYSKPPEALVDDILAISK